MSLSPFHHLLLSRLPHDLRGNKAATEQWLEKKITSVENAEAEREKEWNKKKKLCSQDVFTPKENNLWEMMGYESNPLSKKNVNGEVIGYYEPGTDPNSLKKLSDENLNHLARYGPGLEEAAESLTGGFSAPNRTEPYKAEQKRRLFKPNPHQYKAEQEHRILEGHPRQYEAEQERRLFKPSPHQYKAEQEHRILEGHPHQWSSQLSTIASESEASSTVSSRPSISRSLSSDFFPNAASKAYREQLQRDYPESFKGSTSSSSSLRAGTTSSRQSHSQSTPASSAKSIPPAESSSVPQRRFTLKTGILTGRINVRVGEQPKGKGFRTPFDNDFSNITPSTKTPDKKPNSKSSGNKLFSGVEKRLGLLKGMLSGSSRKATKVPK